MENKNTKKYKIMTIISTICSIFLLSAVTYATLTFVFEGGTNQIVVGKLVLTYDDDSANALDINSLPLSNAEGQIQEDYYSFTLNNGGHGPINYSIEIVADTVWEESFTGLKLNNDYVTVGVVKNEVTQIPIDLGVANGIIDSGTIAAGETNTYQLRLWVDENDVNAQTKGLISEATWHGKLAIHGEQYLN